jgi:maltooligosyltrehalose trehalohydrolase
MCFFAIYFRTYSNLFKVALYAPARAYGTPEDLKELVNSAHKLGLAIIIDLVYNHLGPDGNYLSCYNPHYFTNTHSTPWGPALNYDLSTKNKGGKELTEDQHTDATHAPFVRTFVVDNAVAWMQDYHFDGARLDATHAIVDYSSPHVLQELVAKSRAAAGDRKLYFFAEDDRNEVNLVTRGRIIPTSNAMNTYSQLLQKMVLTACGQMTSTIKSASH